MGTSVSVPQSERERVQRNKKYKQMKEKTSLQESSQVAAQNKVQQVQRIPASNVLTETNQSKNNNLNEVNKKKEKRSPSKLTMPEIEQEVNEHVNIDQRLSPAKNRPQSQNIKGSKTRQNTAKAAYDQNKEKLSGKPAETTQVIRVVSQQPEDLNINTKQNQKYAQTLDKDKQDKLKASRNQEDKDNNGCSLFGNKVNHTIKSKTLKPENFPIKENTYQAQNISFDECDWNIPKEATNIIQEKKKFTPETSIILNHNFAEINSSPDLDNHKRKWKTRREIMNEVIEGRRKTANDDFMLTALCQSQGQQYSFLTRNDKCTIGICNDP